MKIPERTSGMTIIKVQLQYRKAVWDNDVYCHQKYTWANGIKRQSDIQYLGFPGWIIVTSSPLFERHSV